MQKKNKQITVEVILRSIVDRKLTEEEINSAYEENPYLKNLVTNGIVTFEKESDKIATDYYMNSSLIAYLLSNIHVKVLKHNMKLETGKDLTEDEIIEKACNTKLRKITSLFKKIDLNLPWEEKAKIYQDIHAIASLEELSNNKFFNTKSGQYILDKLKNKDWQSISNYYICMANMQHRKKYKELGIETYLEKKLSTVNKDLQEKRKYQKMIQDQLMAARDAFTDIATDIFLKEQFERKTQEPPTQSKTDNNQKKFTKK